jgi:hypothetical protein
MFIFALGKHLMWSRPDGNGGTTFYYYYDEYTWIVGALALAWLSWMMVRRYRRARGMRRTPRRNDYRLLRRIAELKSELSLTFMRPDFSANIHAVGIGLLGSGEYCIQVFVNDANQEIWTGGGAETLPDSYSGSPLVLIEMPQASFLSDAGLSSPDGWNEYPKGVRDYQEVIIGGISGANTNLIGQSGTIGYFCTRKSMLPRRKDIHLLSNSHVFADLRKAKVDDGDLITQPSPGELASNRPIGALVSFSELKFEGDTDKPNHIDAALARLWGQHRHELVLPFIGAVKGYVAKQDVEVGEAALKVGRTTGCTRGRVFSIYLDIRIRYDRTGQSAFFQNQFLIETTLPQFTKFVDKGDSGSLVVDGEQYAIGLIFAGMSGVAGLQAASPAPEATARIDSAADKAQRIEGYGVANPISEVLDRLKIELLV